MRLTKGCENGKYSYGNQGCNLVINVQGNCVYGENASSSLLNGREDATPGDGEHEFPF